MKYTHEREWDKQMDEIMRRCRAQGIITTKGIAMKYTHERDRCLFCGMRAEIIAPTLWQCTSCRMSWKDVEITPLKGGNQVPIDRGVWGVDDVETNEELRDDEEL